MKKYIVKQTTNWNGRGEKTATFTIQADTEEQANLIIAALDGKVEVYEMSATLGNSTGATLSTSLNVVDSIRFSSSVAKTVYVSAYNRPIVFKAGVNLGGIRQSLLTGYEPFGDLHPALKPDDVSMDSGDSRKL